MGRTILVAAATVPEIPLHHTDHFTGIGKTQFRPLANARFVRKGKVRRREYFYVTRIGIGAAAGSIQHDRMNARFVECETRLLTGAARRLSLRADHHPAQFGTGRAERLRADRKWLTTTQGIHANKSIHVGRKDAEFDEHGVRTTVVGTD